MNTQKEPSLSDCDTEPETTEILYSVNSVVVRLAILIFYRRLVSKRVKVTAGSPSFTPFSRGLRQ